MKRISDLLQSKSDQIWSIEPTASVYDAIALMAEKNIGAVMVMEGDRLVGILSERDYARKVILENRTSATTRVDELMTRDIVYAEPTEKVDECMALMTDKRIRHLPVMADGKLLGLVSIGDLVKAVIEHQQFEIDQLEHYISGAPGG